MQSQFVSIVCSIFFVCAASGCTVIGQYKDLQDTNVRVQGKETELAHEEERQAELQSQMKQLSADLNDKKMTSDQLDARLAVLQKQNQRAATDNDAQRTKKRELDTQLVQYRAELAAMKQKPAADPEEQRRNLERLKGEIRKRLALLAQAG